MTIVPSASVQALTCGEAAVPLLYEKSAQPISSPERQCQRAQQSLRPALLLAYIPSHVRQASGIRDATCVSACGQLSNYVAWLV